MNYIISLLLVLGSQSTNAAIANDFVNPIKKTTVKTVSYDEIHDQAIFNCPFAKPSTDKQKIIEQLIQIEKQHNMPPEMRGMLLAAACHESGYNSRALGDHKFSKTKKAMAMGLFQMWPWWESIYKIDRKDPKQSADAYLRHVKKMIPKVKKACRHRTARKTWLAAWATAIRAPKKEGRCNERPKFTYILDRWHKNIKKEKKAAEDCAGQDGCGC